MNIHAYAICWNEEKVLPFYLEHYSKFCNKITIYDNESTDKSVEIIRSFPNTEVISWSSNNEIDERKYLEIKNNCWKKYRDEDDVAIVGDIDELLYHSNITEFFEEKVKQGFTLFSPDGYTMISEIMPPTDMLLYLQVRTGVNSPSKAVAFVPRHIKEINYEVGAHSLSPTGNVVPLVGELKYLHYHFLTKERTIDKYAIAKSRLSKNNIEHAHGVHYLTNKDKLSEHFDTILASANDVISNYGLTADYKINRYLQFDDTAYTDEYQKLVYGFVKDIMLTNKFKDILDIGCGSGYKLVNILGEFNTVGSEIEPALSFVKSKYPDRQWVKSNFLEKYDHPVDIVMASDVIEHLVHPDTLILYMKNLGAKYIVVSTPVADNVVGPPANTSHVREWAVPQFKKYMLSYFKEEQITHQLLGSNQVICIKTNA